MNDQQVRSKLRTFIIRELIRDETYELEDTEPIITAGLIDSFALAELGVFIEDEYGVYIPDPDLTVEKMNTLNQMVERILRG